MSTNILKVKRLVDALNLEVYTPLKKGVYIIEPFYTEAVVEEDRGLLRRTLLKLYDNKYNLDLKNQTQIRLDLSEIILGPNDEILTKWMRIFVDGKWTVRNLHILKVHNEGSFLFENPFYGTIFLFENPFYGAICPYEDIHEWIKLEDGKFLRKSWGKYEPNLLIISPIPYMDWDSVEGVTFNLPLKQVEILRGRFFTYKKGIKVFEILSGDAPHILIKDSWGGAFEKSRGGVLPTDGLYYRRASSKRGGEGNDYAVVPKEWKNKVSIDEL